MNTPSTIIEALGWTLLHFLWQGTAVAAALWLVLLAGKKLSSRLRYNAVALALAAMVVWPVATFLRLQPHASADRPAVVSLPVASVVQSPSAPVPLPEEPVASPTPARVLPVSTPPPATGVLPSLAVQSPAGFGTKMRPFFPWLVGLWALGVGVLSLRFFLGWQAVQRTRRSGRMLEDAAWTARFAKLKARLEIARPVTLLVSATAVVPMVIGWVKPVVLVPAGLFIGLSAAQLEAILAHELAHIRRCDYLANLCQTAVETVLFYHPAVWWVSARLREEREHCCDDVAASLTGSARDYARALTALEEIRGVAALPSGAVSAAGGSLLSRVRRLLGMAPRESTGAAPWVFGGVALLVAALAVTGVMKAQGEPALPVAAKKSEATVRTGKPGEVLEIDRKYRFQFLKDKIILSRPGKDLADPGAYVTGPDGAWPTAVTSWPVSSSGAGYVCGFDTAAERLWLVVGQTIWPVDYGSPNGMVLHGNGGASYAFSTAEAGGFSLADMPDGVRDALKLARNTGVIVAKPGDSSVKLREWKNSGANFNVSCEKGGLSFGRSDGSTLWIVHGDVKLENEGDYTLACEPDAKRLWVADAQGAVKCIEFDPEVRTVGTWKKGDPAGDLGGMTAKVREALKLPTGAAGLQPVTDGTFTAQVLAVPGQEQVVILTKRPLTADPASTSRSGAITMAVATSAKTETIRYTWQEDNPGVIDLKVGGYAVARFDLTRGRVFFIHFEKMEFSADVFQVPAEVEVPIVSSPATLTQAGTAVEAWYAGVDDRALWERSRVIVPEADYKPGQPLDAAAEKIVWSEPNEAGLRLGLGGLERGVGYPIGQALPVKQYIRNDGREAITLSPTQVFNEGVDGELIRTADGRKFPHRKGYRWNIGFTRVRLAPGHYYALGSGPLRTWMAEKDGSSSGAIGMLEHGFSALPGDYTLQLTHGIGQFLGRPVNSNFGNPGNAPGLGEWTGVLKSAAVPLRLADQQIKTARAGGSEAFGKSYKIDFDKGVLKLRHYNGYPNMSRTGGDWEDNSRDWKVRTADGDYLAAWAVGGKGIWVKDAEAITRLDVKDILTETGHWTLEQAAATPGLMPDGVRAAFQLPPLAPAAFDFRKLPRTAGAARIDRGFFTLTLPADGAVLKVPHGGKEFFIECEGSTYGPATGNPVVELGLADLLRQKLAETPNTAGLALLEDMITNGRGTIRDCAFRLLGELKAPQSPFAYDALFHAMISAEIEDEGAREISGEGGTGYMYFHNLFHTQRLEWERTRPLMAADRYQPGEKMADPGILWTPGPDGLSLGISGLPEGASLRIGKSIPVVVYLRNDSPAAVSLSVPTEHNPVLQISLTDVQGVKLTAHYPFSGGLTGYQQRRLEPGTGVKVASFDLEACATAEEADSVVHKPGKAQNPRLAVPAGRYTLYLDYRNYQEHPVPKGAAAEWTGKFSATPVAITMSGNSAASAPVSPPSVRGLSLAGLPVHPASPGWPHAFGIDELYEANADTAGRHRQREDVYDLQLPDEPGQVWMKLRKGAPHFFIEFQDRTIGPVPGDPFDKLNLVDYMLKQRFPSEKLRTAEVLRLIRNGGEPCVRAACKLLQGFAPADATTLHGALAEWAKNAGPSETKVAVEKVLHPTAPTIRGVSLDGVPSTEDSDSITGLAEPDPDRPGKFRQKFMVFEMPLYGEPGNAWLKYPADKHLFYIELGSTTYGPIDGDPVPKLKLDELLRQKLAEEHPNDALLRLEKMIYRGDTALRESAFALMQGLKEPKWRFDYDSLIKTAQTFLDERIPADEVERWKASLAGVKEKAAKAREKWEAARVELLDSDYSPGENSAADEAGLVWTPAREDGMVVCVSGIKPGATWKIGEAVSFDVFLRNNGSQTQKISWTPRIDEGLRYWLTDEKGARTDAKILMNTSRLIPRRTKLEPGQQIKFKSVTALVGPVKEEGGGKGKFTDFSVAPGRYKLEIEARIGSFEIGSADTKVTVPAKGEWTGTITTQPVELVIVGGTTSSNSAAPTIRGVSLDGLPGRDDVTTIAELYEPRPGKPGEMQQRAGVFFMSLGEVGPWLYHAAGADHFYIEVRPDPKIVKDVIYGPISGHAAERLDLAGWLKESPKHKDPGYAKRVARDMLGTGDGPLAELALSWLREFKAPSPPDEHDRLMGAVEKHLKANPRSAAAEKASTVLAQLKELAAAASAEWEKERPTRPEADYSLGESLEKLDDTVQWAAPAPNGLRLGLSGVEAGQKWEFGSQHTIDLYLRNDGTEPVRFAWTARQDDGLELLLTGADGQEIQASITMWSTLLLHNHTRLDPGHFLKLKQQVGFKLLKTTAENRSLEPDFHGNQFLFAEPGAYRFTARCHLGLADWADGKGAKQMRPKGEWEGRLETAPVEVSVVDKGKTAAAAPVPAYGPAREDGLRAAWVLDPAKESYHVGEIAKCRVLFHNSGKAPITFETDGWHQHDTWMAADATGAKIEARTTWFSGLTPLEKITLGPGETKEIPAHGVGIGLAEYAEATSLAQLGCELWAKPGDDVTCVWDVQIHPSSGERLRTGPVKFKVTAAPPAGSRPPVVASQLGSYDVAPGVILNLSQIGAAEGYTNYAWITWEKARGAVAEGKADIFMPRNADPKDFSIPTFIFARGASALWIVEKERVRKIDFSILGEARESAWRWAEVPADFGGAPDDVRGELIRLRR